MEIFHCNECYVQMSRQTNRKFYLTSCGHIFCDVCEENKSQTQCKLCLAPCALILISNEMPANLKMYFCDMMPEVKKLLRIYVIRLQHCKLFIEEYVPLLESKYKAAKTVIEKQNQQIEKLKKENVYLKNKFIHQNQELIKLKDELEMFKREISFLKMQRNLPETPPASISADFKTNEFSLVADPPLFLNTSSQYQPTALELLQNRNRNSRGWIGGGGTPRQSSPLVSATPSKNSGWSGRGTPQQGPMHPAAATPTIGGWTGRRESGTPGAGASSQRPPASQIFSMTPNPQRSASKTGLIWTPKKRYGSMSAQTYRKRDLNDF